MAKDGSRYGVVLLEKALGSAGQAGELKGQQRDVVLAAAEAVQQRVAERGDARRCVRRGVAQAFEGDRELRLESNTPAPPAFRSKVARQSLCRPARRPATHLT